MSKRKSVFFLRFLSVHERRTGALGKAEDEYAAVRDTTTDGKKTLLNMPSKYLA